MSRSTSASILFSQPKGLYVLFLAEACERFSFYGMRALLLFYLVEHFLFDDKSSIEIWAVYGAMVYFMPVVGGFLADRYLGFKRAVIYGALLLCVGHSLMAIEGDPAVVQDGVVIRDAVGLNAMFFALSSIVLGVGFLKSAISNMVGQLYERSDPRRDQGFTIFYMGINIGALLATIICGYLGTTFGWSYGFGLAGIVMLVGLVVFLAGSEHLRGIGDLPKPELAHQRIFGLTRSWWVYVTGILMVIITRYLLEYHQSVQFAIFTIGAASVVGLITWVGLKRSKAEFQRVLVVLLLIVVAPVFWSLFEQFSSSMKLFADRNMNLTFWFIELDAAQIDFLNPLFIICLAPVFAMLWDSLNRRGREPSTPMKFALAIVQAGLAAMILAVGCTFADDTAHVSFIWLVLTFLLFTTGELCISPVGLSMVTRYTMTEILGIMMGIWFLASSVGSLFAGGLAKLAAIESIADVEIAAVDSLPVYQEAFYIFGFIGLGTGVLLFLLAPFASRFLNEESAVKTTGDEVDSEQTVRS